jgi:Fe-S cluster assembly iron-binding protein IscA/pimeloyl-ACP methyl ester carboxylesterase
LLLVIVTGCGNEPAAWGKPGERPAATAEIIETFREAGPGALPGENKPPPKRDAGKPQARARNIVVLTPQAAAKIRELMKAQANLRYLRVRVVEGHYKLDLDPETDPAQDYQGESRGVRVVIDRDSAKSILEGTVVDYIDEAGTKGFKISAPADALGPPDTSVTLAQARRGFRTELARRSAAGEAPPEPPAGVLRLIRYPAPAGKLAAYLTPDPKDGKKHPAVVWITGGDCNSIDQGCWREGPPRNDQSASAYRKVGLVMMFPSLRGGNDNPGVKEGFLGEVDDVLAAADYLRKLPFVDPARIYLGGHSTGGTLVLLVAEYSDRFRAVFSFGPVENVLGYGPGYAPFVLSDRKEARLRAPGLWLHAVRSPTFVFEGTVGGNTDSLRSMARTSKNPKVHFLEVKGANHFDVLAPTNRLIAEKLLRDTGPECNLTFTAEEVSKPFQK